MRLRPLYLLLCGLVCFPLASQAVEVQEEEEVQEPESSDMPAAETMEPRASAAPIAPEPAGTPATPTTPVVSPPIASASKPDTKPPGEGGDMNFDMVLLQGLNKVTARAQTLEAPIGSVIRYGTIEIVAHKCWKASPEDRPENAAFLEVSEIRQGEAPQRIYSGWMLSSTPGLSSLEHPFYDITVIACSKSAVK